VIDDFGLNFFDQYFVKIRREIEFLKELWWVWLGFKECKKRKEML